MASPNPLNLESVTAADIEAAVAEVQHGRPLSLRSVWLQLRAYGAEDEDSAAVMVPCFVLHLRANGFMLVVPDREDVREVLEHGGSLVSMAEPAFFRGTIELMTSQRRRLGTTTCFLVDLPWAGTARFFKPVSLRGRSAAMITVEPFEINGAVGRPTSTSCLDLAQQWIMGDPDTETAEEHTTAPEDQVPQDVDGAPLSSAEETRVKMQARVQVLEQELLAARAQPQLAPPMPKKSTPALTDQLFAGQQAGMSADSFARLQKLAGPPPPEW